MGIDYGAAGGKPAIRGVSIATTNLADGNFIASRFHVDDGETMTLTDAGAQDKGNSAPSGVTAVVKDETSDNVVFSKSTKRDTGDLATVSGPADVRFSAHNDTGGKRNVGGYFAVKLE